jgi:hypothetical protein
VTRQWGNPTPCHASIATNSITTPRPPLEWSSKPRRWKSMGKRSWPDLGHCRSRAIQGCHLYLLQRHGGEVDGVGFNPRKRASNSNDEHRRGEVQIDQNGCRSAPFAPPFLSSVKIGAGLWTIGRELEKERTTGLACGERLSVK